MMMEKLWNEVYNFREAKMPGVKWEPVTGEDPIECLFVRGPNDIRMEYANNLGSRSFWKALPFKKNQFF